MQTRDWQAEASDGPLASDTDVTTAARAGWRHATEPAGVVTDACCAASGTAAASGATLGARARALGAVVARRDQRGFSVGSDRCVCDARDVLGLASIGVR
jgi:hypothetical protein